MIVIDGKISRGDATRALNEGKKVSERGDGKIYIDDIVVTDFTAIDTKREEMQAEYDAQEYARNRQAEYPSVQELVVGLYDTDDKSAIEAKRAAVKAKYPKP